MEPGLSPGERPGMDGKKDESQRKGVSRKERDKK